MISIPQKENKSYSVSLGTDLFGNLGRTRSLDFNKPGYIALSRKPNVLYTEVEDVDFETPLAILSDDDYYYVVTSEDSFRFDISSSSFGVTKLTAGSPVTNGFQSDGTFFNGELHASGTTTISSLTGTTWTSDITGLSSSYPHPLCVSEHQQYLAVGNGNTVRLYDTAYSLIRTLTIPADHVVTWIRWRANLLWCGTRNIQGGEGKVFLWNGAGTAAQSAYGVGSEWAFSGCVYDERGTIVVVSANGRLLYFTGSGFAPLRDDKGNEMAFPVYYLNVPWGSSAATSNLLGKVASRGMEARGSRIYMVVDSSMEFGQGGIPDYVPDFPGGLWVFDPKVGLYHKAGVDHKKFSEVTFSSLASDTLTLSAAQIYETGDPVYMASIGDLTGDVSALVYYAIKVGSTQIKLALTPQQALAGDAITITGSVAGASMYFNTYESVGAMQPQRTGGVCTVKAAGSTRFFGIEVVYSSDVRNAAGTTIGAVMSLGMGRNVGSFVTSKIQASAVTDTFSHLVSKFGTINIATRQILIKYRTKKRWGLPGRRDMLGGSATWVDSSSFTINPKLYDMYSVQEGDEVEFLNRAGGGYTAHITDITIDSATQWTITIDETMPDVTAGELTSILIDNWTKYKVVSTTEDAIACAQGFVSAALDSTNADAQNKAKWVELKFEMRGYTDIEDSMEFEEVVLTNTPDQNYA